MSWEFGVLPFCLLGRVRKGKKSSKIGDGRGVQTSGGMVRLLTAAAASADSASVRHYLVF